MSVRLCPLRSLYIYSLTLIGSAEYAELLANIFLTRRMVDGVEGACHLVLVENFLRFGHESVAGGQFAECDKVRI